eukprot:TRINITY_DN27505_c0_g1_i1.p1 TRINITY_DN27505_c0_g1~~TRINITY_DN27505_c0_g1_i1.p1  ORF type:complete len:731 (+),score=206.63 TRINITY_DN27505_c0_g1_i1:72-2264(+)
MAALPEGGTFPPVKGSLSVSELELLQKGRNSLPCSQPRSSEDTEGEVCRIIAKLEEIRSKKIRKQYVTQLVRSYESRLVVLEEFLSQRSIESLRHGALTNEVTCRRDHSKRCESTIRALQQKIFAQEQNLATKAREDKEDREKEKLRSSVQHLQKQAATFQGQIAGLTSDIEEAELKHTATKKELAEAMEQISHQQSAMAKLERNYETAAENERNAQQKLVDSLTNWETIEQTLKKKIEEHLAAKKQADLTILKLEEQLRNPEEDTARELEFQTQLLELHEAKEVIEEEHSMLQSKYDDLLNRFEQINEERIDLQQQLMNLPPVPDFSGTEAAIQSHLKEAQELLTIEPNPSNSLSEELQAVREAISVRIDLIESLRSDLNEASKELNETKTCLLNQQETYKEQNAKLLEAEKRCDAYAREIEHLNSSNPLLMAAKEKAKKREAEMKQLEKKMHVAPELPRAFKMLLARMDNSVKKVNEKLSNRKKEIKTQQNDTFFEQTAAADSAGMVTTLAQPRAPLTEESSRFQNVAMKLFGKKSTNEATNEPPPPPNAGTALKSLFMRATAEQKVKKVDPLSNLSDAVKKLKASLILSEGDVPADVVSSTLRILCENLSKSSTSQAVKEWLQANSPQLIEPKMTQQQRPQPEPVRNQLTASDPPPTNVGQALLPDLKEATARPITTGSSLFAVAKMAANRTRKQSAVNSGTKGKMNFRDFATELVGPRIGDRSFFR